MQDQPTLGMFCRSCGDRATTAGQAFCGRCGAPLAPPPPAPPSAPPPAPFPSAPPVVGFAPVSLRRRRGPVVAVVLAVVLVLAAAIGGTWALLAHSDPGAGAGAHPAVSDATSAPTSAPPTTPSTPSASPQHPCWYGGATAGTCRWPSGRAGLRWVFPSACGIAGATDDGRTAVSWCLPHFHYSGWPSQAAMLAHYRPSFLPDHVDPPQPGTMARRVLSPHATYKVVIYYLDSHAPWDVTVYADNQADYERLVPQVRMRPAP